MIYSERHSGGGARPILRGQDGQTAVLALLCMITLFGFVALVASMGRLVVEKIRLQNAADLAAFSGAAVQAAGLNELARINEDVREEIEDLADKTFNSKEDGIAYVEDWVDDYVNGTLIPTVRRYAQDARLAAGQVATHNFPGASAYQIGVQVDPDSDDLSQTREELRRFNARNSTKIHFHYWDWDDGYRVRKTKRITPEFLYHTPLSNTAFWARMEATIKPPALPSVFFLDAPNGILLTADSMASPYDGHTGTPNGTNLRDCRPEYRVKFTPINHRDLTFTVPGSSHFLVRSFPGVVQAGKYIRFKAAGTNIRDVVEPSVDPMERYSYAH